MAKDNRRIVSGIPTAAGTFYEREDRTIFVVREGASDKKTDEETTHDDLEAELTPTQVEYLKKQGALEGDWTGRAPEVEVSKESLQAVGGRSPETRLAQAKKAEQSAKTARKEAKAESKPHVERLHDKTGDKGAK